MTKKKKKKREEGNRKNLLLIILLFLFGVFGTVTYAWFSSDMKLNIDTMEIHIATMAGIQVSANAVNWSNTVTKEDIINAYNLYPDATNQLPLTLSCCSTDGGVNPKGLNMFYGSTREQRGEGFLLTAAQQTEINCVGDEACMGKHYIAFDIFVLLTEQADLVITDNSYVKNISESVEGGENSARVGFVNLGTTTDTVNSSRAQFLFNASSSSIWEPNYDTHTDFGLENAENVYEITTTATGAARLPYKGINSEIGGKGVAITATNSDPHFSLVNPKIATTKEFTGDQD